MHRRFRLPLFGLTLVSAIIFVMALPMLFATPAGAETPPALPVQAGPAEQPPPQNALERAWQLAEQSGSYEYRSAVEQTVYPPLRLGSAGREPQTTQLGIEGAVDRAAETMALTLWPNGSFDPSGGVSLKVEDGLAYARAGETAEWEPMEGVVDMFAPGGDPLGFLAATSEVTFAGQETTALGGEENARTFDRYTFAISGVRYGSYLKGQMEAQMRARGELPPGVLMQAPEMYARMTGTGEIWLRPDGLPTYMTMDIDMPLEDGQRVEATITNDFWNFDEARLAALSTPLTESPSSWLAARLPQSASAWQTLLFSMGLLMLTASLLVVVCANWQHPKMYTAFAIAVIATMLLGPLMRTERVYASDAQRETREEQQESQQAEMEQRAAMESAARPVWNPQQDPMAAPRSPEELGLEPVSGLEAPTIQTSTFVTDTTDSDGDGLSDYDEEIWLSCPSLTSTSEHCEGVTDSTDTDGDGLSDGVEVFQLGTAPAAWDTDGDTITDTLEIEGWEYNDVMWYSNPVENDTNHDGRLDGYECPAMGALTADGTTPLTCPDTDGDGTPDMFDNDNDNDGVPDDVDLSPEVVGDTYNDANPFKLSVDNLTTDTPAIVNLQFRPTHANNLNLQNVVLDWPLDEVGNIKRTQETTFADTPSEDAQSADALAGNGDLRLTPILEITIPYSDGSYGNLPVLPAYQGIDRTLGITVGEWLDEDALELFSVAVNDVDETSGDLVAYVPMGTVTSQKGDAPVAFNALMYYEPSQVEWGAAHEYRVLWLVQMLQATDTCASWSGSTCTLYEEEVKTLHIYDEEWELTGLEVSEEEGMEIALLYEDPTVDDEPETEEYLWNTSWNLQWTFLEGRDCDTLDDDQICQSTDDERDVTVDNIESTIAAWSGDAQYISVVMGDNPYAHTYAGLAGVSAESTDILTDTFAAYHDRMPTLLTLSETQARTLNLNDSPGAFASDQVALDMDPDEVPTALSVGMSWRTYEYDSDGWVPVDTLEYADILEATLETKEFFLPTDDSEDAADEVQGKLQWAQMYYIMLVNGLNNLVELDDLSLWVSSGNTAEVSDADVDIFIFGVSTRGYTLLGYYFAKAFNQFAGAYRLMTRVNFYAQPGAAETKFWQAYLVRVETNLGRGGGDFLPWGGGSWSAVFMMALLFIWLSATVLYVVGKIEGDDLFIDIAEIVLLSLTYLGYGLWMMTMGIKFMVALKSQAYSAASIGKAFKDLFQAAKNVSKKFQIYPKYSLFFDVGLALAIMAVALITSDLSNPFNVGYILAYTLALILLALVLFAIGQIPIIGQFIVILYYFIDALLLYVWDISAQNEFAEWFAEATMEEDPNWYLIFDDADRLDYDFTDSELDDPVAGFVVSNSITLTMDITNTIEARVHKLRDDGTRRELDKGYAQGWAGEAIYQSAFDYDLVTREVGYAYDGDLPDGNSMRDDWEIIDSTLAQKATGRMTQEGLQASVPFQDTGINRDLTFTRNSEVQSLWIVEKWAQGYSACGETPWATGLDVTWEFITGNSYDFDTCYFGHDKDYQLLDIGSVLQFDILPLTIEEFYDLDTWNNDGNISFPVQEDQDGDGLPSAAVGGADDNDELADTDGDGLLDGTEPEHGTLADSADADGDGLVDGWELVFGTDPYLADSDSDGLSDYTEKIEGWIYAWQDSDGSYHKTRIWSDPLAADADMDTLNDLEEFVFGSHPQIPTDPSFIDNLIAFEDMDVYEEGDLELLVRFEEEYGDTVFADLSGNDHTITCVDDSKCPLVGEVGRYGSAISIGNDGTLYEALEVTDGVTDMLRSDFTLAFWVKPTEQNSVPFEKGDTDGWTEAGEVRLKLSNYIPQLITKRSNGDEVAIRATQALTENVWQHVAVRWDYDEQANDGTGNGTIWIDGVNMTDPTSNFVADVADGWDTLYMAGAGFVSNRLNGSLDEVAIWSTALTQEELLDYMAGRYNPDDLIVQPGAEISYRATISNTHGTQGADGHIVATSEYHEPEIADPVAALRFEDQDLRLYFENEMGEDSGLFCYNDGTCPTLRADGYRNATVEWDGGQDVLWFDSTLRSELYDHMMSFWLRVESLPASGERAYLLDSDMGGVDGELDIYLNDAGNLVFEVAGLESTTRKVQGGSTEPWIDQPHITSFSFSGALNTWTYVVFRYNGAEDGSAGGTSVWINDVTDNTSADTTVGYSGSVPLLVGPGSVGNSTDSDAGFDGRLDEWVFYDDNNIPPFDTAAVNWWPMQEVKNGNYTVQEPIPQKIKNEYPDAVPSLLLLFEDRASNLDGEQYDYATEGTSFTCYGNACPDIGSAGVIGNAASFNGGSDYLTLENLNLGGGDYTLSGWFNSSAATQQTLVAATDSDSGELGLLLELQSDGRLNFLNRWPAGSSGGDALTSSASYNDGSWHHVAATREEALLTLFVDGVEIERGVTSGTMSDRVDVTVGRDGTGSAYFSGTLDEWVLVPAAVDGEGVRVLRDSQFPIIRADDEFVTFDLEPLDNVTVVGTMQVSDEATSSRHYVKEEVEAALNLSQDITIPVVDQNEADLITYVPFEDAPGTTIWENVVDPQDSTCADDHCPVAGLRGYIGRAAYFDGVDDYLPLSAANNSDVRSIAVWVKGDQGTIYDTSTAPQDGLELDIDRFQVTRDVGGGQWNEGWWNEQVEFTIPANVWTHVVATMSNDTAYVYLNGQYAAEVEISRPAVQLDGTIGSERDGGDPFRGYLDDLRLYETELSADDALALYTESAALMNWEFDEPEEATAFTDRASGAVGVPSVDVCLPVSLNALSVGDITGHEGATLQVLWEGATIAEFTDIQVGDTLAQPVERVACGGEQLTIRLVESDGTITPLRTLTVFESDITSIVDSGTPVTYTSGGSFPHSIRLKSEDFTFQPNPAPGTDGKIGNTALFNDGGYIRVEGGSGATVAALTDDFTVMVWASPELFSATQTILATGRDASTNGWAFGIEEETLFFESYGGTRYTSDATLDENVWQQVAVSIDSSNLVTFYVDGIAQDTTTLSSAIIANSDDPLYIGASVASDGTIGDHWDGELDELTVYQRALSEEEVFSTFLRELRWYRAHAYGYVAVDDSAPGISLLTDVPYHQPGYIQLGTMITDTYSAVGIVEWGLKQPSDSDLVWDGIAPCESNSLLADDTLWCPYFTATEEGTHQFQFRALDMATNETTSELYELYVDATAPEPTLATSQWISMTDGVGEQLTWTTTITGTVSDPDLPGGIAGSGVNPDSVTVTITDSLGEVLGDPAQRATLDGDVWTVLYKVEGTRAMGEYTVSVGVEDQVGNQSETEVGSVIFDERQPLMDLNLWEMSDDFVTTREITGTISEQPDWGNELLRYHFEPVGDGTTYFDSAEYELDLSCAGDDCPTSGEIGVFGDAIRFDGTSDELRITDVYTDGGPLDVDEFTFSMWLRPTAHPNSATSQGLLSKSNNGNSHRAFDLSLEGLALKLQVSATSCAGGDSVQSVEVLELDEWQHVVASYDGATLRLYLNGAEVASEDYTGGLCENDYDLVVGGYASSSDRQFAGTMDELRIWDRALLDSEIYALQETKSIGVAGGDVAPYEFDEAQGDIDLSTLDWQPITVTPTGGLWGEWTHTLPADLEGLYTLYGRGSDEYGNTGDGDRLWFGLIDTRAPRVTLTVEHLGSGDEAVTAISWEAEDLILSPDLPSDVCADSDFGYTLHASQPYVTGLSKSCYEAGHTSGPWTVEVCDLAGHCTEETVSSATSGPDRDLVTFISPKNGEVFDTLDPISISGIAFSPDGLDTLTVTANGETIHSESWSGSPSASTWSFDWTPEWGEYELVATLLTTGGATITDTVSPEILVEGPEMSISKTVTPTTGLAIGDSITYTIVVSNDGPADAVDARLTDILPDEVAGDDLDETLTIAANSQVTRTITGVIESVSASEPTITNTATLTYTTERAGDVVLTDTALATQCSAVAVSSDADSGPGSLRDMIASACDGATVNFTQDRSITLASPIVLSRNVTIDGDGFAVVLDGADSHQLFEVAAGVEVTLRGLTLQNGSGTEGGAIRNSGTLTIERSALLHSSADEGGAIYNTGDLTLRWSTLSGNSATSGAGAIEHAAGKLTVENVTIAENTGSSATAGGINTAAGSTLVVKSSILATNSSPQCRGAGNESQSSSLMTDHESCGSNALAAEPLLGTLGDYGGATPNHPLLPGSPALDTGSCTSGTTDQRGEPIFGSCDVGSFESQGFTLTTDGSADQETWINSAFPEPLTVTVTANNPEEPVAGGELILSAPDSGPSLEVTSERVSIGGDGVMSRPSSANGTRGDYEVTVGDALTTATLSLTNLASELTIDKTMESASGTVLQGDLITYTLSIGNDGNAAASGVSVTDALPSQLEALGVTSSGVAITETGTTPYVWTVDDLDPGASGTITLSTRVRDDVPSGDSFTNSATIETTTVEEDTSDNTATTDPVEVCTTLARIYVDGAATGDNHGDSWSDALITLQDALLLATECGGVSEIWVAAGTYYPDEGRGVSDEDASASFELPAGVALYGGFASGESSVDERDAAANLTILSGDIGQDDTVDGTGVVVQASDIVGTNSDTLVSGINADGSTLLDGFTLTASAGRGLYELGNGTYRHLHLSGNGDGGIYLSRGTNSVDDVRLTGHNATGAGLYHNGGTLTLRDATFQNNESSGSAGAIWVKDPVVYSSGKEPATLVAENLLVMGNRSNTRLIYNQGGTVTVTNATIVGNALAEGYDQYRPILFNSSTGGIWGQFTLTNAIVWGNSTGEDSYDQTFDLMLDQGSNTLTVVNSIIQTGCTNYTHYNVTIDCTNVTSDDPRLASPSAYADAPTLDGDARLTLGSPAIDAGESSGAPSVDIRGAARPAGGGVDIGAYEAQGWTLNATSGDGQSAVVNSAFAEPLAVTLASAGDLDPVGGLDVTFSAPNSGASSEPASAIVTTDESGTASLAVSANGIEGSYDVTATIAELPDVSTFGLTNVAQTCDTITVSSNADSGAGTLRQALADACDGNRIEFASAMTIELESVLEIERPVAIDGTGQTITLTLSATANDAYGIIVVQEDAGDVTLTGLTLSGGRSTANYHAAALTVQDGTTVLLEDSVVSNNHGAKMGAIFQEGGTLTIRRTTITSNSVSDEYGSGGGIHSWSTLTITHSTVSGNTAESGGGIYAEGETLLRNSTVSGNEATEDHGGGLYARNSLTVEHSTIVDNVSQLVVDDYGDSFGMGAGLANAYGDTTITHSIIAGNRQTQTDGSTTIANDCFHLSESMGGYGTLTDGGHNLFGEGSDCPTDSGTTQTIAESEVWSELIEPLGDYGGSTETHALMDGAVAIDAGDAASCASDDQRGEPRGGGVALGNATCDIGAYEAFSTPELAGDVSCDASLDLLDSLVTLQYDLGSRDAAYTCPLTESDTIHLPACDGTGDGTCDLLDTLYMTQCDLGTTNPLCPAAPAGSVVYSVPDVLLDSTITVGTATIAADESSVTIPVTVETTEAVAAAGITVNYDPTVAQMSSCEADPENQFTIADCNEPTPGEVRISVVSASGRSGTLLLGTITFERAPGLTSTTTIPLPLTIRRFTDPALNPLPATVVDGELTVEVTPTSTTIALFEAASVEAGIEVRWATVAEETTDGFNIYRSESPDELGEVLNPELIPAQNSGLPQGASYTLLDEEVLSGIQYFYTLEVWDMDGTSELNGPTMGTYGSPTAVTLSSLDSGSYAPSVLGAGLILMMAALGWVWRRRWR